MDRERDENNRNNENDHNVPEWLKILGIVAGVGVGIAAVAGLVNQISQSAATQEKDKEEDESDNEIRPALRAKELLEPNSSRIRNIPDSPVINNLNSLFEDIYVRYVGLRQEDFDRYYKIFITIFMGLHRNMKDVDDYYSQYSGAVEYAGSHYDRLRIKKPDEFDMDVVIGLPLNYSQNPSDVEKSDIIIEPNEAGYVQLRMGEQFRQLPYKSGWETNMTAYRWGDSDFYLRRSSFISWFQGVVHRALNRFALNKNGNRVYVIDGEEYTLGTSASGPAITLKIRHSSGFKLDVDLVPVLRFPEARWPPGPEYISIPPSYSNTYWHVAPKPNKNLPYNGVEQARSWRISLHCQERKIMYNSFNLRKAIMMMKQLRDSQEMCKVSSYSIKTLALWEVVKSNDPHFGQNNPVMLFKLFVDKFLMACETGRIDYIWHIGNNLLDGVKPSTLNNYAYKLRKLKKVLDNPSDYRKVAKYMLTPEDYEEYKRYLY